MALDIRAAVISTAPGAIVGPKKLTPDAIASAVTEATEETPAAKTTVPEVGAPVEMSTGPAVIAALKN